MKQLEEWIPEEGDGGDGGLDDGGVGGVGGGGGSGNSNGWLVHEMFCFENVYNMFLTGRSMRCLPRMQSLGWRPRMTQSCADTPPS